jgi:hypothetical protein
MILEVLTDACEVERRLDPERLEVACRPDPGEKQELR